MALPVINVRPEKTVGGYDSKWNAGGGDLPLLYEIENDKFPQATGGTTTGYTVSSQDDKGRAILTVSTTGTLSVDDYVRVLTGEYIGRWIVMALTSTTITINKLYTVDGSGAFNATPAVANYKTQIDVYAGIPSGHPLTSQDPIELVGTLDLVPDTDNITRADVKTYVQKKLSTFNNAGLTNDYGLWSGFYIVVREIYDSAYGVTVTSSDVDDSGNVLYAANATLPFQNPNGGNMADYVCDTGRTGVKWLTSSNGRYFRQTPYFDISAILNTGTFDLVVTQFDSNGTQLQQDTESFSALGLGVYRFDLSGIIISDATDYLECVIQISSSDVSETLTVVIDNTLCIAQQIVEIGNFMLYEDDEIMLYEDDTEMLYEL